MGRRRSPRARIGWPQPPETSGGGYCTGISWPQIQMVRLVGHLIVRGAMMICADAVRTERQNRKNAVERRRQRGEVSCGFISPMGSWVVWFFWLFREKSSLPSAVDPPPDSPGAGATQSVLSLCSGLVFQAAGRHTQSFVNRQPITWPRFRTSPASAGRLDCLHPLQKKRPGPSYSLLEIFLNCGPGWKNGKNRTFNQGGNPAQTGLFQRRKIGNRWNRNGAIEQVRHPA